MGTWRASQCFQTPIKAQQIVYLHDQCRTPRGARGRLSLCGRGWLLSRVHVRVTSASCWVGGTTVCLLSGNEIRVFGLHFCRGEGSGWCRRLGA